ncbi:SPOC domain-containing protein 1 isoform X2 [Hemicordylus capensis]|uniref:SPOC domain-containing protein 1 isoform X2 n=1 Tax=Hemicordylus capensis TaxID=884348 RepID=UPI00230350FB|nr:SPOC domain-containing protein 1 isoform X2 [Hemicordylus capensis]
MEGKTGLWSGEENSSEDLVFLLSSGAENRNASETQQDSNSGKDAICNETKFLKETIVIDKASEIVNIDNEESRVVLSEKYLLNLADLEDVLEKNDIKEQNDTLKFLGVKTLGETEKIHSKDYSEAQTADKVAVLQKVGLGVMQVAETVGFYKTEAQMKDGIIHTGFSGQLLDSWKKDVHLMSSGVSETKDDQEDFFSVQSLSRQTKWSAPKAVEITPSKGHISENGQHKQLLFAVDDIQKEEVCIDSEEDFSCGLDSRKEETDQANCKEVTGLAFESSSTNTIKSCFVPLKNICCKMKEKNEYLVHPNAKELPQRKLSKSDVLKKLRAVLHDLLEKKCIKKLEKPLQIQDTEALLENATENKVESNLEVNISTQIQSSGEPDSGETHPDHDMKTESNASSPDITTFCDIGIFEKFSFMASSPENSIMDPNHSQGDEKGAQNLQLDSVLISETQKLKTRAFEFTENFVKYKNGLVNQVEKKEASHTIDDHSDLETFVSRFSGEATHTIDNHSDLETFVSRFSGEAATDNTSQPHQINSVPISCEDILQSNIINSTCSSAALRSETKLSQVSLKGTGAFPLFDETSKERNVRQATCELESCFVSSLSGDDLKLGLNDTVRNKTKIKMPLEGNMTPCSVNASAEEVIKEQETPNQRSPIFTNKNDNNCWFLLKIDQVIEVEDRACVRDEENLPRELESGDALSDHVIDLSQPGSESEHLSVTGDVTTIKHSEVRKGTVLSETCDGEINNAEENMSPHPAKENRSVEELSGPVVKLLGTPHHSYNMRSLGKLAELKVSSDDEFLKHKEGHCNYAGLFLNSVEEGKPHSADVAQCKPLSSDDSMAKKKTCQRPNKTPVLVHSSQLSQEQSRIKVVDALKEVLQKRLDDSPDLNVQKNTVSRIALKVEREIFRLFCCVDQHYKNKYRSLLFNLKSTENQDFFRMVILGEITPRRLVQMTSLEMAPKELIEWRESENKRVLSMIEKEEREAPKYCPTKFTHKGIVEIHKEADEDLIFQEIFGLESLEEEYSNDEALAAYVRYPGDNHRLHNRDSNSSSCAGQVAAGNARGIKPLTSKCSSKEKASTSRHLHPDALDSDGGERPLQENRADSPSIPKKQQRVEKEPRTAAIWKGLIQMFSLKQFAAKAFPVSGSNYHLFQTLPYLLQSKGCILPEDVWAYLDNIWPESSKEMGVIRFLPSLAKGLSPYNMLYSYLNVKQRYGIVDISQMEMFMVPLAAFQPVPSKLHPLGGPGLDPCHPSLLLGLILPKRPPPTGALTTRPSPLPKAKRKRVTFQDSSPETSCSALPSQLQADTGQAQPRRPLPACGLLCGNEGPQAGLRSDAPLAHDALLPLPEDTGRAGFHGDPSSLLCTEAGGEAYQAILSGFLQSLSGSPWTGEPLDSLALDALGAQPQQAGDQVQFCVNPDPAPVWNPLECLPPSHPVHPDPVLYGTDGAAIAHTSVLPNLLCAGAVPARGVPQVPLPAQIPCTSPVAGDTSSLMEETWSLLQQVTQLQCHLQSQAAQPPAAFGLPVLPQEATSVWSQAAAGPEFPPTQHDEGMYAQLQLLFSTFGGQAQPPSSS